MHRLIWNFVNYNDKEASVTLNFNQLRKRVSAEDYFIDFKFEFTPTSAIRCRQQNFIYYRSLRPYNIYNLYKCFDVDQVSLILKHTTTQAFIALKIIVFKKRLCMYVCMYVCMYAYTADVIFQTINKDIKLRWLDIVFQGQYVPSLSVNYVAMSKDLEKLTPQLY